MNICSAHLKLKKCLTYVTLTEFWKLNATCNISPETAELRIWMTLKEMRQTRRAGLLNLKEKGMTICYIMNRCLVMFLRGRKVNIMQYWWNIITKLKVNKLSLSEWLTNYKLKIPMLYQDNYFVASVKLNFGYCIDDHDDQDSLCWWSR